MLPPEMLEQMQREQEQERKKYMPDNIADRNHRGLTQSEARDRIKRRKKSKVAKKSRKRNRRNI